MELGRVSSCARFYFIKNIYTGLYRGLGVSGSGCRFGFRLKGVEGLCFRLQGWLESLKG